MKKKIGFAAAIMHDYSGYKLFISNMKSKKLWAFELDKFDINH